MRLKVVAGDVAGDSVWSVLRRFAGGFALDAEHVARLRGLVGLYEGTWQISTCLIVDSEINGGELLCTVKRETTVADRTAPDFIKEGARLARFFIADRQRHFAAAQPLR